jgi:hypothetical protein
MCSKNYIFFGFRPPAARRTRTARVEGKRKCVLYSIYSLVSPPAARRTRTARGGGKTEMYSIYHIFFGFRPPAARRTRTARGRGNGNVF